MSGIDSIAQAMGGGAQVKKNTVLVVGATGTLGRQVRQHPALQSRVDPACAVMIVPRFSCGEVAGTVGPSLFSLFSTLEAPPPLELGAVRSCGGLLMKATRCGALCGRGRTQQTSCATGARLLCRSVAVDIVCDQLLCMNSILELGFAELAPLPDDTHTDCESGCLAGRPQ